MSINDKIERYVVSTVDKLQDMVGKVIFDYTGISTSDYVNTVILAFLALFVVVLVWALRKPHESVYHYDLHR